MPPDPLLRIEGLTCTQPGSGRVLADIALTLAPGEVLGLAGESGSGKSTLAHLLLGYRIGRLAIAAGSVRFREHDMLRAPRSVLDRLRGARIALVPQNPATALDPRLPVGRQIAEALDVHGKPAPAARIATLLADVGLPDPSRIGARYPHQLSGGQQQRVVLAMALACAPDLLVLDEPTTGLDVTTQARILDLLRRTKARSGMAMLYVTHDLGVMAHIADRVAVLYAGHLMEVAPVARLFAAPRHPYTRGLIAAVPRLGPALVPAGDSLRGLLRRADLPPGCPFAPRCPHAEPVCAAAPQHLAPVASGHHVACRRWPDLPPEAIRRDPRIPPAARAAEPVLELRGVALDYRRGFRPGPDRPALVSDINLALPRGETLALVGESGSGKSTIARAVAGLLAPAAGTIWFEGQALPASVAARVPAQRRAIQFVFQNPDASLNPRATIGATLARPLAMFGTVPRAARAARVAHALEAVQLDPSYASRYPDELSGGERQRVAIARALIVDPALILCDEVLSALDVSVQAHVLALLRRLRAEQRQTMLFISHDLAVVQALADRIAVLYRGRVMQAAPTAALFDAPLHPYTSALLDAVPDPDRAMPAAPGTDAAPPPGRTHGIPAQGCAFAGRCALEMPVCARTEPAWRETGPASGLRCHAPTASLPTPIPIAAAPPMPRVALSP